MLDEAVKLIIGNIANRDRLKEKEKKSFEKIAGGVNEG